MTDVELMVAAVQGYVKRCVAPLVARVAQLEAAEAERKKAGGINYCGAFREGEAYSPGEFVTHNSSLWYCLSATETRPATSPHWVLAVRGWK
jgi:hypothetical protein